MKKRIKFAGFASLLIIAACAVITVNIYFPEKEVKEAYKALEKELMTDQKGVDQMPGTKPDEKPKPESSIHFELVTRAYAQEAGMAERIAEIVKKMPDVVDAYKGMGARIADTDRLRDSGSVGEGNNGLLSPREKTLSPADKKIVDMENENRQTVIKGMAKAIIRVNRAQETPENLKQVTPQATEQFTGIRRDAAKKGWWIQDANGNWGRK
ncbi:MAG: DUF1318 domain-containing protein [Nitrospira bacterium HGW-Nitrospira-1]|nr:MAG: DUF1318 domain-containing protein [Nitrospira bacterium HGW-Nitrospira-1]